MKKNKLIIFAFLSSFLLTSCNDLLDLQDDGRITLDQVFNDYNRTRGYLNSCYGYARGPYMDRASYCDEAQDADDISAGSTYYNWYSGNVTPYNFIDILQEPNIWDQLWQGIRKCNVFIESMKTATVYASEEEKAGWVAQARTLRALYYLQLIKRFGGVPIIKYPMKIDHDFSKDRKASFGEVVKFIIEDCDSALLVPDTEYGFHWEIYDNQFQIMTRAVAYAIKSEAVTYAASPLWSDGTFSWVDATEINAEALAECLSHDYKLFDETPAPGEAQNAYALYHIISSNDKRARDKETIYQLGGQMAVWQWAGMPTTPNMMRTGPCPTQDLVDAYEMANGEPPIFGYNDADKLHPIINSASGYDPQNPYDGRDPRFYASIYYNGAVINLAGAADNTYNFTITQANQVDLQDLEDGSYHLKTTGGDPYVMLSPLASEINPPSKVTLSFDYIAPQGVTNLQIFFGAALSEARSIHPDNILPSNEWKTYILDITQPVNQFSFGKEGDFLRLDFGTTADVEISIKNIKMRVVSTPEVVESYAGGPQGISLIDKKHTRTGYYLRKFNNYRSNINNNLDGSVRLFRLAELYLNFAESAYQSAGPDEKITYGNFSMSAREAVNAIRKRAGMPPLPAGMSKEEFEKRYRNERRIELAFEEHRFYDVRRWKILKETDKFVTGMWIEKNTDNTFIYNRFKFDERLCNTDKFLIYPIPQNEVNKIIALSGENWQNPGW